MHNRIVVCLASVLACAGPGLLAEAVPWVLPWNDSTPGVTDDSALNSTIGPDRVLADTNGHFMVAGKRIRFLGVTFNSGDSPFVPTNNADAVAARLAKFGVNNVRFHFMDGQLDNHPGLLAYTATTSTNLNAAQLEQVHFLVSRLKAHGVYSDINLLVGHRYRSADGLGPEVARMEWNDTHILGYFYEPALALQKDYAAKLLKPVNRFTGLPLAKEPAVALVEINNEMGMIQKWLDGGLDRLPPRYATSLQSRWNAWLAERYANGAAMLAAWKVVNEPPGSNLLKNGDFRDGLTGWLPEHYYNAGAKFTRTDDFTNGGPSAKISVTNADPVSWHIQFSYRGLTLAQSQVYTLSFWAKSNPRTNADAFVQMAHEPWSNLGVFQTLSLTTNWQQFSYTFESAAAETNAGFVFGSMGDKLATFWFADVRLRPGGQIGVLPPGASLAARTVPNIRHSSGGYGGTRKAQRDWLEFLRNLEYGYFDAMAGYLRTNIGYGGLIVGTITATSPATVQNRLDVIDAHNYWQQPRFPGRPWDPVDWFMPNVSMVNSLVDEPTDDENSIACLARQRIRGKPFIVTEYQHPSPNSYGAEGPLLLAAYAGLQDWDGIWLYDYGPGNDVASMGYVRGFFEIGQHPAKMANLLLAANLFRRGDVRPAVHEHTMALTPERELDLLRKTWAWVVFTSGQMGVPGKLALISRLDTSIGANPAGLSQPPAAPAGNVLASDTGQLRWDLSVANHGVVTFDTPRTKGLVGYADNRPMTLGALTFRPGTSRLGWCTLGITLKRGQSFTNDCSALLVATGWCENTGQVWKDANKNSVGNHWGGAPILAEIVPFTLTLPVGVNNVRVWSLDPRGKRLSQLPLTGDASSTTLNVTSNAASIWYEVEVSR